MTEKVYKFEKEIEHFEKHTGTTIGEITDIVEKFNGVEYTLLNIKGYQDNILRASRIIIKLLER